MLADLPRVASTGPAFEPPLLVPDGPTAALNPGGTSCLTCETLHPAAKTQRQKSHVNLYTISHSQKLLYETFTTGWFTQPFVALLLAAVGWGEDYEAVDWLQGLRGGVWDPGAALVRFVRPDWVERRWPAAVGWLVRLLSSSSEGKFKMSYKKTNYDLLLKNRKIEHTDTKIKISCRFWLLVKNLSKWLRPVRAFLEVIVTSRLAYVENNSLLVLYGIQECLPP